MIPQYALLDDLLLSSMNPDVTIRVSARALLCMVITTSDTALSAVATQLRHRLQHAIMNPQVTPRTMAYCMRLVMSLFDSLHEPNKNDVTLPPTNAKLWEVRLKLLMDVFYYAVEYGLKRPEVAEEVYFMFISLLHIDLFGLITFGSGNV
jgi:hypothetical protein